MECCTCNKTFKTISSLNHHRKTALFCLKMRGEAENGNLCSACNKSFARKYELLRHMKSCGYCKSSDKFEEHINDLEQEV